MIHDEQDSVGIPDAVAQHLRARRGRDGRRTSTPPSAAPTTSSSRPSACSQVQHCAIEPHVTIGWLDEDDRLVLRTSTQVPFHVRRMVAPLLGLPVKRIRVIKPRIGGGFGGKQEMLIEDIVGHLVLATRRPVRLELTREEEFISSRTRHAADDHLPHRGQRRRDARGPGHESGGDTGAYGVHGFTVQSVTGLRGLSSYNCPAKRYHCDVVYTNRPVAGAMRGYGAPQGVFALESHMDDIARGARHRSDRAAPAELGRSRRHARHRPAARRARRRRGRRPRGPAAHHELRHRGMRRPGAAGDRLGPAPRPVSGSARPTGRTSAGASASRCACMGSGIAYVDMGSCLHQDERRRFVQPARRRHRSRHRRRHRPGPDCRRGARRAGRRHPRLLGRHRPHPVRRRRLRLGNDLHLRDGRQEGGGGGTGADRRAGGGDARSGRSGVDRAARPRRRGAPDGRSVALAEIALRVAAHRRARSRSWRPRRTWPTSRRRRSRPSSPRSRWTSRPGEITVTKLVIAVDCGVADQPDHRERAGRGWHDHGARLRPLRGARPRRGGPAAERAASGHTGSSARTTRPRRRSSSSRRSSPPARSAPRRWARFRSTASHRLFATPSSTRPASPSTSFR